MEALNALGWSPFFETQWLGLREEGLVPARIVEEQRELFRVHLGTSEMWGELTGTFRRGTSAAGDFPAVGDWVIVRPRPSDDRATILRILQRRTKFSRKASGETQEEQVVAANMDLAFLVMSLNDDLNLRRMERYLTLVGASGATPVVVLTKADLVADPSAACREVEAIAPGVQVLAVSSKEGRGLDVFRRLLGPGMTAVLLGSSGVGKSTLVNRLLGTDSQKTRAIREEDGKGRHTTTARRLLSLADGGMLIDTPGMRELQLWEGEEGIDVAFEDVLTLATGCRFTDCRHASEPGCAVHAAIAGGTLARKRWENFAKLRAEIELQDRKTGKTSAGEEKGKKRTPPRGSSRRFDEKKRR